MRVFVLLYNDPNGSGNGGIHTLVDRSSGRNKVLMFASEDDATRFALMLEAQDFPTPTPEAIDRDEVIDFCRDANYEWELVPEGSLVLPPEQSVDEPDWQPDAEDREIPTAAVAEEESTMSQAELDLLRRKLEELL